MRVLALLLLSLPEVSVALAGTQFNGTVTDSSQTPIANAMILIHWDSAGSTVGVTDNIGIKDNIILQTQENGTFSLDLPPGWYDVFAAASAFTPTSLKIRIKEGGAQNIKLRLKVDPLYGAEMGKRIQAAPHKRRSAARPFILLNRVGFSGHVPRLPAR
jgi:Carboxypeptidase regulatory-like domain